MTDINWEITTWPGSDDAWGWTILKDGEDWRTAVHPSSSRTEARKEAQAQIDEEWDRQRGSVTEEYLTPPQFEEYLKELMDAPISDVLRARPFARILGILSNQPEKPTS